MPRENSFSDSDGRSLTPDMSEDEEASGGAPPMSPASDTRQQRLFEPSSPNSRREGGSPAMLKSTSFVTSKQSLHSHRTLRRPAPKEKFRLAVRKVIHMNRGANKFTTSNAPAARFVGAEPGVDPRRATADLQYGGIRQNCVIEMFDYSVRGYIHLWIALTQHCRACEAATDV